MLEALMLEELMLDRNQGVESSTADSAEWACAALTTVWNPHHCAHHQCAHFQKCAHLQKCETTHAE